MTPICPQHKTPMRESEHNPGTFYCPKKDGDEWCTERVKPANQPAAAQRVPVQAPRRPTGSADSLPSSDARYIAALSFAASLYRGGGAEMLDDALAVARKIYASFPEAS